MEEPQYVNSWELRLHNHYLSYGRIITVQGFRSSYENTLVYIQALNSHFCCWCDIFDLRTLPLNEKYVRKLGFNNEEFKSGNIILRPRHKEWHLITTDLSCEHGVEIFLRFVTHVHQLQNLMMTLTGSSPMFNFGQEVE